MLIEQRPSDDSEVAALVVDQQAELRVRDGGLEGQVAAVDPTARYLVAVMGGDAVACGAIRALDIDTAEIKRMYVRPAFRGRGIARRMLAALEGFATMRGHVVSRLETGVYAPEAIALYLGAGYRPIPRFGQYVRNVHSRCFEKRLDGTDRRVRVVRRGPGDPEVVELVAAAVEELADCYGGEDHGPYPVGPSCRFVVVAVDGEAAGCGAIQPLDDQTVEVKWMYVTPAHRGKGLARRLLAALEDLAAGAHYPVVRLQIGVNQPKAIALYESAGYRQVPSYGPYIDNPYSRCYEKLIIDSESIALGSA